MAFVSCYRDLEIWKKSIKLVKEIYKITDDFPRSEIFGLINQLRRSAVSIPSNIAEGHSRNSSKEFKQFLYIALGSIAELETQLIISQEVGYIKINALTSLQEILNEIGKMTRGLIAKL